MAKHRRINLPWGNLGSDMRTIGKNLKEFEPLDIEKSKVLIKTKLGAVARLALLRLTEREIAKQTPHGWIRGQNWELAAKRYRWQLEGKEFLYVFSDFHLSKDIEEKRKDFFLRKLKEDQGISREKGEILYTETKREFLRLIYNAGEET